jgi:cardiolipin synthase
MLPHSPGMTMKTMFGKMSLVLVSIAVQIAFSSAVVLYWMCCSWTFCLAVALLYGVAICRILVKRMPQEAKLSWLFFLTVTPFFGVTLYYLVVFTRRQPDYSRRAREIGCAIEEAMTSASTDVASAGDYPDGRFVGIAAGLFRTSGARCCTGSETLYFDCGESFLQDMLVELEKAEKFIFMDYFIIKDGRMWRTLHAVLRRKAADGVEVRILCDDFGSMSHLSTPFRKYLEAEGIALRRFNVMHPCMCSAYNERDHRKITVIDGTVGYVGGVNIGDEYILGKAGDCHWKDTAIRVRGPAVRNLTAAFLMLYDLTEGRMSEYPRYLGVVSVPYDVKGLVQPFSNGPREIYGNEVFKSHYLNLIHAARKYVYITTPYLVTDDKLLSALESAVARGVDVRIIIPQRPGRRLFNLMLCYNAPRLLAHGVRIFAYGPGFIHAKTLVSDDVCAVVGSINLDFRSMAMHHECGVTIYGGETVCDIRRDFEATLSKAESLSVNDYKMNGIRKAAVGILGLISPIL